MIVVDTSVWVSHLRQGSSLLEKLLNDGEVACHSFIVGELACGNMRNRAEILALLQSLPMAEPAEHEEVLEFIEGNRLMGQGLGYIDMHLLASAVLSNMPIWTFDRGLRQACSELNAAFAPGLRTPELYQ